MAWRVHGSLSINIVTPTSCFISRCTPKSGRRHSSTQLVENPHAACHGSATARLSVIATLSTRWRGGLLSIPSGKVSSLCWQPAKAQARRVVDATSRPLRHPCPCNILPVLRPAQPTEQGKLDPNSMLAFHQRRARGWVCAPTSPRTPPHAKAVTRLVSCALGTDQRLWGFLAPPARIAHRPAQKPHSPVAAPCCLRRDSRR